MENFQGLNIVTRHLNFTFVQKRKPKPRIVSKVNGFPDVSLQDMLMINSIYPFNICLYIYIFFNKCIIIVAFFFTSILGSYLAWGLEM